jgi:sugar lactone lactonase YvrE
MRSPFVKFLFVLLALALSAPPARAALTLTAAGTAQGLSLSTFASGFPVVSSVGGNIGPQGIAFPNAGGVLVSDYTGNVRLFPTDTDGQNASAAPIGQNYLQANAMDIGKVGSSLYMSQQPAGALVQINANGSLNQSIVSGLPTATGVAINPTNGHVFVAARGAPGQIFDVDPIAKTKTLFTNLVADDMVFSPDGSTLYASNLLSSDPNNGHVFGFNTTTKAQVFDSGNITGGPMGMFLGNGAQSGKLFVITIGGTLLSVDLTTSAQTVLASGGSRGEFIAADPNDGSILIDQSDSVVRVTGVPEPAGALACAIGAAIALSSRRRARQRHGGSA